MKRVLVLAESDDLSQPTSLPLRDFDAVVLAFWSSPEFAARLQEHGARACWRLNDLVSDYGGLVRRAYHLAHTLAERAPVYRAVNPLRAWENILANALFLPLVVSGVQAGLIERAGDTVQVSFLSRNDTQRAFDALRAPRDAAGIVQARETTKAHAAGGRLGAWLTLLHEARRDGDWANVLWVPLETLDASYAWRARLARRAAADRGGTLFYSSYVNFSRALAAHQGAGKAQWLVNSHSARRGLPPAAQAHNLWEFGIGRPRERRAALAALRETIAYASECQEEFPLRAALAASSQVRETLERVMPLLLAEIDLMHASIETLAPEQVWVANQWGGEGCMLQAAHAHGVPVTQVQHGLLEEYYVCAPIYTEQFLVWNEFWRQIVNPDARAAVRVAAVRGAEARAMQARPAAESYVTFFTSPPEVIRLWNPSVVRWETATLVHALIANGDKVILRAHPLDRLEAFASAWQTNFGALPGNLVLDKGTPLEPLLARTRLAVMGFSTVLLDCAARGIPVVGLGWYKALLTQAAEQAGYIRFADSLRMALERCTA